MSSKIIFVLASLCVINASVITINVIDDDPDSEVAHIHRGCNFRACVQSCRKLGFTGGTCIHGRCKCDTSPNTEDDPDTEVAHTQRGCNFRACVQLCRKLGFTGGTCIHGRCKCDTSPNTEDEVSETVEPLPDSSEAAAQQDCNLQVCVKLCRILGLSGGACVSGRCNCNNFLSTEETHSNAAESTVECDYQMCNQRCQRLGDSGGSCVSGRCKCNHDRNSEEPLSQRDCNFRACEQLCRRLGFTGGACVNGRCKCDNFLYTEDEASETVKDVSDSAEPLSQHDCNFRACEQLCRRLGFTGGACVNGRCKCDNFLYTEDGTSETVEAASDSADPLSQRDCNFRACEQLCRRIGFTGGACVNGRCKCDNFLYYMEETISDSTEQLSQRGCNLRACEQLCRRLGFTGGTCVHGHCKCDNGRDIEDNLIVAAPPA